MPEIDFAGRFFWRINRETNIGYGPLGFLMAQVTTRSMCLVSIYGIPFFSKSTCSLFPFSCFFVFSILFLPSSWMMANQLDCFSIILERNKFFFSIHFWINKFFLLYNLQSSQIWWIFFIKFHIWFPKKSLQTISIIFFLLDNRKFLLCSNQIFICFNI